MKGFGAENVKRSLSYSTVCPLITGKIRSILHPTNIVRVSHTAAMAQFPRPLGQDFDNSSTKASALEGLWPSSVTLSL